MRSDEKPTYNQMIMAMGYWEIMGDVAAFFKQNNMPTVCQSILSACDEIGRMWECGDYKRSDNNAQIKY